MHQSRKWIAAILKAAKGTALTPKQIFDAQTPPMDMKYPAVRKLLREMLRGGLQKNEIGYYLIDELSGNEIAVAHRGELFAELDALVDRHRKQRRTTRADILWALQTLLQKVKDER
jgi:hypothetical protein